MRYDTELNVILAFLVISSLTFLVGVAHKQPVAKSNHNKNESVFSNLKKYVANSEDKIFSLLTLLLIVYVFTSISNIHNGGLDILALLAVITILAVIGLIFYVRKPCTWLERIAIHVMIVLSIYFATQKIDSSLMNQFHLGLLLICIGLIAILFITGGSKQFVGSPLDFLLIATAIVIPNLPRSPVSDPNLSILVIKLIILFYCIEYVLFNIKHNWWAVRSTLALCACVPIFMNFL